MAVKTYTWLLDRHALCRFSGSIVCFFHTMRYHVVKIRCHQITLQAGSSTPAMNVFRVLENWENCLRKRINHKIYIKYTQINNRNKRRNALARSVVCVSFEKSNC